MYDHTYFGYIPTLILLFVVTGACIIWIDTKRYEKAGMKKESRTARFLGWGNVVLGLTMFLSNWIYQEWFFFR